MNFDIVNAGEADLPGILAIYNDAVQHTTAIWNETLVDLANRRAWLAERTAAGFPVLVAHDGAGEVVGELGFLRFVEFTESGKNVGFGAVEVGALEIEQRNVLDEAAVEVVGATGFVEENRARKIDRGEFAVGTQRAQRRGVG